jgi:hydroxymethylglutaryl-CoA lyase
VTLLHIRRDSCADCHSYVSCIFADPYDGPTQPASVLRCVKELLDAGCYEVSLGDTLGVGSPSNVRSLITFLLDNDIPGEKLAGHFHDTYGQAVANVWEAYKCGLRVFDSSVAGLGGCPFAPGAKGNVATEDLVYMFHNAGISTGVDLPKLVEIGVWISDQLKRPNGSRAGAALAIKSKSISSVKGKSSKYPSLQWNLTKEAKGLQLYQSGVNLKVVLNRAKNGNALTAPIISALTSVVTRASKDPQISRIIITGNGRFFCTGMDLGKGSTPVAQSGSASVAQFHRLTGLFESIDQSPKVTIACLNGPAFGGGVGLAFSCDIRLATLDASVTLSEVKLGLCPATISKYVVREWGIPFAREAMLSARPVSVEELRARGLVFDVADGAEELSARLDILLSRLKVASPGASRMSKELVRLGWAHAGRDEQVTGIKGLFEEMMHVDADGAHGVKEFQAGRKVDWDAFTQGTSKSKL